MHERDDTLYLQHILDSIDKINRYLKGIDEAAFPRDSLIQDGVIRQLGILGEAVKRLSLKLRDQHADIPWKDIACMRDKLIHDYMGVDMTAVWHTTTTDVPVLQQQIEKILARLNSDLHWVFNVARLTHGPAA